MTSQVSSPAEQADEAALGELREQRNPAGTKGVRRLDRVIIRFAGDSGDGMQLTGDRFTSETATFGNDLSTLPNFPAEIRAPAGTLPGVSSFQLHFADHDILTPGDAPNVLVAMNPAALRANIGDVPRGAEVIGSCAGAGSCGPDGGGVAGVISVPISCAKTRVLANAAMTTMNFFTVLPPGFSRSRSP